MRESRTKLGGCAQWLLDHPHLSIFLAITGLGIPTLHICVWITELREKYHV